MVKLDGSVDVTDILIHNWWNQMNVWVARDPPYVPTDACDLSTKLQLHGATQLDDWPSVVEDTWLVWGYKVGTLAGSRDNDSIDCWFSNYCPGAKFVVFEAVNTDFKSCGIQIMGEALPCPPDDCSAVIPQDLASGLEPDDFIVKYGDTHTFTWPHFETDATSTCTTANDCSNEIQYTIFVYDCSTCSDGEDACSADC